MKNYTIEEGKQLFEDIDSIMKNNFPFYECDDKDDYLYLVRDQHIKSTTMRILEYLDRIKL